MKRRRNFFICLSVFLLLLGIYLGSVFAAEEKVTLRFATWDRADQLFAYQAAIDQFHKLHPDIEVKIEATPEGYDQKILTGLASGTAPDVFLWWNFPPLVKQKGATDLAPFIKEDHSFSLDIFYNFLLPWNSVNGKLVALPNLPSMRLIYYNKDIFDKAGVTYPKNGWTWDDFEKACKKITDPKKRIMAFVNPKYVYPLQGWIWSNGGDYCNNDATHAIGYANSPKTVAVIQWLADLQLKKKIIADSSAADSGGGTREMFKNGRLAMFEDGSWPLNDLESAGMHIGVVIPPVPRKGMIPVTTMHSSGFVMASNCKYKEQTWDLMKAFSGELGNKAMYKYNLVTMPSVYQVIKNQISPNWVAFYDSMKYATIPACYLRTSDWNEIWDKELQDALDKVWLGKATAQQALTEAAKKIESKIKQD